VVAGAMSERALDHAQRTELKTPAGAKGRGGAEDQLRFLGWQKQPLAPTSPAQVLALQHLAGNKATVSFITGGREPLDRLAGALQRVAAEEEQAPSNDVASPVHNVVGRGGGSPIGGGLRSRMEAYLGQDLRSVRVHCDAVSAESVGAKAYTVGENIVVHPSQVNLATPSGEQVLAHEALHVLQQRSGPVDGTPAPGGIRISDPFDRFERAAESSARALRGSLAHPTPARSEAATYPAASHVGTPGQPALQRLILDGGKSVTELQAAVTARVNAGPTTQVPSSRRARATTWVGKTLGKLPGGLGKTLGFSTKRSQAKRARGEEQQSLSQLSQVLETTMETYKAVDIQAKMAKAIGNDPTQRSRDGEEFKLHLNMMRIVFEGLREHVGAMPELDNVLSGIDNDLKAVATVAADTTLPATTSWLQAVKMVRAQSLIKAVTEKFASNPKEDPTTFHRGKTEAAQESSELLKPLLHGTIEAIVGHIMGLSYSSRSIEAEFPDSGDWDPKVMSLEPPEEFVDFLQRAAQQIALVAFPRDAGYIGPEIVGFLGPAIAHAVDVVGVDLAKNLIADKIFLRGISPGVTVSSQNKVARLAVMTRGSTVDEVIRAWMPGIVQVVCNRAPGSKAYASYGRAYDVMRPAFEAFLETALHKLLRKFPAQAKAAQVAKPLPPTPARANI
jgi:hypothetical protein